MSHAVTAAQCCMTASCERWSPLSLSMNITAAYSQTSTRWAAGLSLSSTASGQAATVCGPVHKPLQKHHNRAWSQRLSPQWQHHFSNCSMGCSSWHLQQITTCCHAASSCLLVVREALLQQDGASTQQEPQGHGSRKTIVKGLQM